MRISDWSSDVCSSDLEGKELVSFGTGVLREDDVWVRVQNQPPIAGGSVMRITHPGPVERIVATWYVVGDVVTASPNRVKLETLKVRLLGGEVGHVEDHRMDERSREEGDRKSTRL